MQNVFVEKALIVSGFIFSTLAGSFVTCIIFVIVGAGGNGFLCFTVKLGCFSVISAVVCFLLWVLFIVSGTENKTGGKGK